MRELSKNLFLQLDNKNIEWTYVIRVHNKHVYIENGIYSVYEIGGDFLSKGLMFRERERSRWTRIYHWSTRTIVNIYKRELSARSRRKLIPRSKTRRKYTVQTLSLLCHFRHYYHSHHLTITYQSSSSEPEGPPTYSTEPRVRGRSKGRRRPAPKEAKSRNDVSTMVRPN